jgi:hypothetical protein
MHSQRPLRIMAAAAVFVLAGLSVAEAGPKVSGSGYGLYIRKSRDSNKLSDDRRIDQETNTGYLTTAQPDNPLNMNTQTCTGTTVTSADGKTGTGSGYCASVDADGDVTWMWFRGDLNAGTWGFLDGTGKFKGIEGGGTWKTKQRSADGRLINTWEGSWQTK